MTEQTFFRRYSLDEAAHPLHRTPKTVVLRAFDAVNGAAVAIKLSRSRDDWEAELASRSAGAAELERCIVPLLAAAVLEDTPGTASAEKRTGRPQDTHVRDEGGER